MSTVSADAEWHIEYVFGEYKVIINSIINLHQKDVKHKTNSLNVFTAFKKDSTYDIFLIRKVRNA
jgi:hypothetical protein